MKNDGSTKAFGLSGVNPIGFLGSVANRVRIRAKDAADSRAAVQARAAGPSVQTRQSDLLRFYERYEDLVEVLCDSAQYGPTATLQRRYADLSSAMREEYPEVRPYLSAFLREAPEDYGEARESQQRPADDFEELVHAEDLDGFLRADDGRMIARIIRTREALNLYGEHLRYLAAKTA